MRAKHVVFLAGLLAGSTSWSAVAAPLTPEQEAALRKQTIDDITARFSNGGRYVIGPDTPAHPHKYCTEILTENDVLAKPPVDAYAGLVAHANAKLLECNYPFPAPGDARRGWVIVVAATATNLTDRLVNACKEAAPQATTSCVKKLLLSDYIYPWGSNNFIYPVTGFVREPCKGGENLLGFRHGVTIQYGISPMDNNKMEYCISKNIPMASQRTIGLTHTTHEVFKIGRVAAVNREAISQEGDFSDNKPKELKPDSFQAYVIANEIHAVSHGYDRMMTIKAAQVMGLPIPPKH